MEFARYVGRVGALAVALGIGGAIGWPAGMAWAQPDGSDGAAPTIQDEGASKPADAVNDVATNIPQVDTDLQAPGAASESTAPAGPGSRREPDSPTPTNNLITVTVGESPSVAISAQTNRSNAEGDVVDPGGLDDEDGIEAESLDAAAAVDDDKTTLDGNQAPGNSGGANGDSPYSADVSRCRATMTGAPRPPR